MYALDHFKTVCFRKRSPSHTEQQLFILLASCGVHVTDTAFFGLQGDYNDFLVESGPQESHNFVH